MGVWVNIMHFVISRFFLNRLAIFLIFAGWVLLPSSGHGFSQVKVKEISRSKKTIVMDLGLLDGLKTSKNGWLFFSNPKNVQCSL